MERIRNVVDPREACVANDLSTRAGFEHRSAESEAQLCGPCVVYVEHNRRIDRVAATSPGQRANDAAGGRPAIVHTPSRFRFGNRRHGSAWRNDSVSLPAEGHPKLTPASRTNASNSSECSPSWRASSSRGTPTWAATSTSCSNSGSVGAELPSGAAGLCSS
jgi:hypothetical protein